MGDTLIKLLDVPGAVRENFKNRDFYTWPSIRYFLYQYEYKLKSETKNLEISCLGMSFLKSNRNAISKLLNIFILKDQNTSIGSISTKG